ncbi:MAG: hypothetical protein KAG92_03800, partial [Deltaproteobacteria bacterium]|nr:hypothetical protein [Deltaproteobacteria bacterium]
MSEQLNLSGALYGGRGGFKITWYQVEKPMLAGAEKSPDKAGERLEISCAIDDVSLPSDTIKLLSDTDKSLRFGFTKAHLDFDVNGDPEAGLRFTANFAAVDHTATIYDINLDSGKNCSRGAVKASLTGFSQCHDGYVNIKSASLEYPGAATLFYRGLVRFNEPLFVDLISELKVADLNLLARSIPPLTLPGYLVKGELAGQLKLIGNPNSAPVLQVELKSDQITLQETELSRPLSEVSPAVTTGSLFSGFNNQFVNFCKLVAKWEWLVKSDCRLGALQLPDMTIFDLSLLAEKNLVQVEVERLAARFGESGELRLSFILEDLLHEPHWQASLIAKKLDLKPFTKTLRFNGILDASLVGGGLLESDSEFVGELGLNGKWHLRQGAFV